MNLLAFRQRFRTVTGRYDLVNSDGSDNGANFFINAGQRHLDRLMDNSNSIGRRFIDISAGDTLVTFEDSRSILEVWCLGPDSSGDYKRTPLTKQLSKELKGIDRRTLIENYVNLFSDITQSRPIHYAPAQLRLKTASNGTTGGIGGFMDVLADGHQTYNGVVLMPPSNGDYSIEVVGNFYSMELSSDTDSSFWSDRHPETLIMSTMRMIEVMHRNSEGVKDWDRAIEAVITGIDMDAAAEESADITEMEG